MGGQPAMSCQSRFESKEAEPTKCLDKNARAHLKNLKLSVETKMPTMFVEDGLLSGVNGLKVCVSVDKGSITY